MSCSGPTIDLATVFPNVGREGVLSQDEQHVKFYFSDDIVPVGGNVYFTTSVLGMPCASQTLDSRWGMGPSCSCSSSHWSRYLRRSSAD